VGEGTHCERALGEVESGGSGGGDIRGVGQKKNPRQGLGGKLTEGMGNSSQQHKIRER